jgi:hypothetical protein
MTNAEPPQAKPQPPTSQPPTSQPPTSQPPKSQPPEPATIDLVALPGSERPPAQGVTPAAAVLPAGSTVEATIVLRRRAPMTTADLAGADAPGTHLDA